MYKIFHESLQIAFPNNVLVSQFPGWSLVVCSIDIYIPRCLINDCFYGPRYVSHLPFLDRSANLWVHWLCASTTASYTLVYLWKFIDYYGECEMGDASMYLERSNRASTHIYGLLIIPRKRGRSQHNSLAFKGTWTKNGMLKTELILTGWRRCILHYHWELLTKVCYRLFVKTLKNHINLWKMDIRWPL